MTDRQDDSVALRERIRLALRLARNADDGVDRVITAISPQGSEPAGVGDSDDALQGHAGTIIGWWRDGDFTNAVHTDNPSTFMDRCWRPVMLVPPCAAFALPDSTLATPAPAQQAVTVDDAMVERYCRAARSGEAVSDSTFAPVWKPPVTHLIDETKGLPRRTLCGIQLTPDWDGAGFPVESLHIAKMIGCGCLRCQKIAKAAQESKP